MTDITEFAPCQRDRSTPGWACASESTYLIALVFPRCQKQLTIVSIKVFREKMNYHVLYQLDVGKTYFLLKYLMFPTGFEPVTNPL